MEEEGGKKIGKSSEGQGRRYKGVRSHKSNFVLRRLCKRVSCIMGTPHTGKSACMTSDHVSSHLHMLTGEQLKRHGRKATGLHTNRNTVCH
jgi:hypothetical protein